MRTISFMVLFLINNSIFFLSDSSKISLSLIFFFSELITVTSPFGLNFKLSISYTLPL